MKPEEIRLEEAVCRVLLKGAADVPPVVSREDVRCLLEATASTLEDEAGVEYIEWDERRATFEVWMLKANRSSALTAESSAGLSTQHNQVHEHCLAMAAIYEPWVCA
jgi:hypothetical protein